MDFFLKRAGGKKIPHEDVRRRGCVKGKKERIISRKKKKEDSYHGVKAGGIPWTGNQKKKKKNSRGH